MPSLGDVSIQVSLDESTLNRQLAALENRKLKPLGVGITLDSTQLDRSLNALLAEKRAIKVSASLDTAEIRRELASLTKESQRINVSTTLDTGAFRRDLQNLTSESHRVDIQTRLNTDSIDAELRSLLSASSLLHMGLELDKSGLERELARLKSRALQTLALNVYLNTEQAEGELRSLSNRQLQSLALGLQLDTSEFDATLSSLLAPSRAVEVRAKLNSTETRRELENLARQKIAISVVSHLDTEQLQRDLARLSTSSADIKFKAVLDTDSAYGELRSLAATARTLQFKAKLDRGSVDKNLARLEARQLRRLALAVDLSSEQAEKDLRSLQERQLKSLTLGLKLDTAEFERSLEELSAEAKEIRINPRLDASELRQELQSLESTRLNALVLEVKLDSKSLKSQLRELADGDYGAISIQLIPDVKGFERKLRSLPQSLVSTVNIGLEPDFKNFTEKIQRAIGNIDIPNLERLQLEVHVDDDRLYELNEHLDIKQKHFDSVQRHFEQHPLTVKVNDSIKLPQLENIEPVVLDVSDAEPRVQVPDVESVVLDVEVRQPAIEPDLLSPAVVQVHVDLAKFQQHLDAIATLLPDNLTVEIRADFARLSSDVQTLVGSLPESHTIQIKAAEPQVSVPNVEPVVLPVMLEQPQVEQPNVEPVVLPVRVEQPQVPVPDVESVVLPVSVEQPQVPVLDVEPLVLPVRVEQPQISAPDVEPVLLEVRTEVPEIQAEVEPVLLEVRAEVPEIQAEVKPVILEVQAEVPEIQPVAEPVQLEVQADIPEIQPQIEPVVLEFEAEMPEIQPVLEPVVVKVRAEILEIQPEVEPVVLEVRAEVPEIQPNVKPVLLEVQANVPDIQPVVEPVVLDVQAEVPEIQPVAEPVVLEVQVNVPEIQPVLEPVVLEVQAEVPDIQPQVEPVVLEVWAEVPEIQPEVEPAELEVRAEVPLLQPDLEPVVIQVHADLAKLQQQIEAITTVTVEVRANFAKVQSDIQTFVDSLPKTHNLQLKTTPPQVEAVSQANVDTDGNKIKEKIQLGFEDGFKAAGQKINATIENSIRNLINLATAPLVGVSQGFFEEVGRTVSGKLTQGLIQSLQKSFNFDLTSLGDKLGTSIASNFNQNDLGSSRRDPQPKDKTAESQTKSPKQQSKEPEKQSRRTREDDPQTKKSSDNRVIAELESFISALKSTTNFVSKLGIPMPGIVKSIISATASIATVIRKLDEFSGNLERATKRTAPREQTSAAGARTRGTQPTAQTTESFVTGRKAELTPAIARGQVEAARRKLESELASIQALPRGEQHQQFVGLLGKITGLEAKIANDVANAKIPETVRRSLGQLKAENSKLGKLKAQVGRATLENTLVSGKQNTEQVEAGLNLPLSKKRTGKQSGGAADEIRAIENFNKLFAETLALSGSSLPTKLPRVTFGKTPQGVVGEYNATGNQFNFNKKLRSRLASGALGTEDLDTIAHEIRHALQLGFGKVSQGGLAAGTQSPLVPLQKLKPGSGLDKDIEASVDQYKKAFQQKFGKLPPDKLVAIIRQLETDAYTFAQDTAQQLEANLAKILRLPKGPTKPPAPKLPQPVNNVAPTTNTGGATPQPKVPAPIPQPQPISIPNTIISKSYVPPTPTPLPIPKPAPLPPVSSVQQALPSAGAAAFQTVPIQDKLTYLFGQLRTGGVLAGEASPAKPPSPINTLTSVKDGLLQELAQLQQGVQGKVNTFFSSISQSASAFRNATKQLPTKQPQPPQPAPLFVPPQPVALTRPQRVQPPAQTTPQQKNAISKLQQQQQQQIAVLNQILRKSGLKEVDYNQTKFLGKGFNRAEYAFDNNLYRLNTGRPATDAQRQQRAFNQNTAATAGLAARLLEQRVVNGKELQIAEQVIGKSLNRIAKTLDKSNDVLLRDVAGFAAKLHGTGIANRDLNFDNLIKNPATGTVKAVNYNRSVDLNALSKADRATAVAQDKRQLLGNLQRVYKGKFSPDQIEAAFEQAYQVELAKVARTSPGTRKVKRQSLQQVGGMSTQFFNDLFDKVEDAFYNAPIFKRRKKQQLRADVSDAVGFLAAGSFSIAPITTALSALAPLAIPLTPILATGALMANIITPILQAVGSVMLQLQPIQVQFAFAGGGKEGGQAQEQFARQVSDDIGTPLLTSLSSYAKLGTASKNTALEGQATQELFEGISLAVKALGLDSQAATGTFYAFQQMISKGKIFAEELRQQLAERFPAATSVFSRALGLPLSEFNRLLESGQLLSQDVLPKVAKQLKADFGQAAQDASGNFISAMVKIENSVFKFQEGLAKLFGPIVAANANTLANFIGFVSDQMENLNKVIAVGLIGVGAQILVGLSVILGQTKIISTVTNALSPLFGRAFATLTPFLAGTFIDLLDDALGADTSVFDNMMQGWYNFFLSAAVLVDGLIKKVVELVNSFKLFSSAMPGSGSGGGFSSITKGLGQLRDLIPSTVVEFTALFLMLAQTGVLLKMSLGPMVAQLWASIQALGAGFLLSAKSGGVFKTTLTAITAGLNASQLASTAALAGFVLFFAKADFYSEFSATLDKANNKLTESLEKTRVALKNTLQDLDKLPDAVPDTPSMGFDLTFGLGETFGQGAFRTDDVIKLIRQKNNEFDRSLRDSGRISEQEYQSRVAGNAQITTFGEKTIADNLLKLEDQANKAKKALDLSGLLNGKFDPKAATQAAQEIQNIETKVKDLQKQRLTISATVNPEQAQTKLAEIDAQIQGLISQRNTIDLNVPAQALARIQEIDKEVKQLAVRRIDLLSDPARAANPETKAQVTAIDEQMQGLLKERDKVKVPIENVRNAILVPLEILKAELKEINESTLAPFEKQAAQAKLQPTINLLEQAKTKLQEVGAVDLSPLGEDFTKITQQIKQSDVALQSLLRHNQLTASEKQVQIQKDLSVGAITPDVANRESINTELQFLRQQEKTLSSFLERRSQQLKELQAKPNPTSTQVDEITRNQKEIESRELELSHTRLQIYQKTVAGRKQIEQSAFNDFQRTNAQATAIIERTQSQRLAQIKRKQLEGKISPERAEVDIGILGVTQAQQTLDNVRRQITDFERIKKVNKGRLDPNEVRTRELDLEKSLNQATLGLIDAELNARDLERKKRIKDAEDISAKVQAENEKVYQSNLQLLKNQELSGLVSSDSVQKLTFDLDIENLQNAQSLIELNLDKTDRLRQEGTYTALEATTKQAELSKELAQTEGQLLDKRLAKQQYFRDKALQLLEDANKAVGTPIASDRIQSDLQVQGTAEAIRRTNLEIGQLQPTDFADTAAYTAQSTKLYEHLTDLRIQYIDQALQAEKNAQTESLGFLEARLEREKTLLESRAALVKASMEATISVGEAGIEKLNQVTELRRKVADPELPAPQREAYASLLGRAGIAANTSELDILTQRQAIEDSVAQARLSALESEQRLERSLLDLDLQRQYVTALTAKHEASIARDRALIAQLEAQAAVQAALNTGDNQAISAAEARLTLNNQIVDATAQQVLNAEENLRIQNKLIQSTQQAKSIEQRAARDVAQTNEQMRQIGQEMERIDVQFSSLGQATGRETTNERANTSTTSDSVGDSEAGLPAKLRTRNNKRLSLLESAQNQLPDVKGPTTNIITHNERVDQSGSHGLVLTPRPTPPDKSQSVEQLLNRTLGFDSLNQSAEQYELASLGLDPLKSVEQSFNDSISDLQQPIGQLSQTGNNIATTLGQIHATLKNQYSISAPSQTTSLTQSPAPTTLNNLAQPAPTATLPDLTAFKALFNQTAVASGIKVKAEDIPQVKITQDKIGDGIQASYNSENNLITLSKEVAAALQGKLDNPASLESLRLIIHEIRHALQFKFGDLDIDDIAHSTNNAGVDLIEHSHPSERVQQGVKTSTEFAKQQTSDHVFKHRESAVRATETDAYAFAENFASNIIRAAAVEITKVKQSTAAPAQAQATPIEIPLQRENVQSGLLIPNQSQISTPETSNNILSSVLGNFQFEVTKRLDAIGGILSSMLQGVYAGLRGASTTTQQLSSPSQPHQLPGYNFTTDLSKDLELRRTPATMPTSDNESMRGLREAAKPVDVGRTETSGFSAFVNGLKQANRSLEQKLDKLNQTVAQTMSRPNLYVTSAQPVSDSARIWSDISRASVTSAGLA